MGYAADDFKAIREGLDDKGLDSSGQSLRDQQKRASSIDRDLPDYTGIEERIIGGVDFGGDCIADAMRAIKQHHRAYSGSVTGRSPLAPPTTADLIEERYDHLSRKELEQEYLDAPLALASATAKEIASEAQRRDKEGK